MLVGCSTSFIFFQFQIIIANVFLQLDPFHKIFEILLGNLLNYETVHFCFALLRFYLCSVSVIGSARIILITQMSAVILMCNSFTFVKYFLQSLSKIGFRRLETFYNLYSEGQIFLSMIMFCENFAFVLMGFGVFTLIFYNFLLIRGFSIFPVYIYVLFLV